MSDRERREVLRMIPHGVQVVTVRDGDDVHGYTSSWMTQASFDPPLVVLGVRADSRSREIMKKGWVFCVHFLGQDQEDVARRFFKPADHSGDKFAGLRVEVGELTGCPVLLDALAYAECRVVHEFAAGDHDIVVGEVVGARVLREGKALTLADTPWQYGG